LASWVCGFQIRWLEQNLCVLNKQQFTFSDLFKEKKVQLQFSFNHI